MLVAVWDGYVWVSLVVWVVVPVFFCVMALLRFVRVWHQAEEDG